MMEKENKIPGFSDFFRGLPESLARTFFTRNIWWHLMAVVFTSVLVFSGFDWEYFLYFRGTTIRTLLFGGVILGGLVPIVVPILLWLYGRTKNKIKLAYAGIVLGQGAIAGYLVSIFYKAFTGRAHPAVGDGMLLDITREFRFGFLRGGIFWGWPSSHTAVAFAMTFALFTFFHESKKLKYYALIYAFYIGLGISMSIHWFSDFAAGSILGAVTGVAVGQSLKTRLTK